MMNHAEVESLVADVFEEIAVRFGGLLVDHEVPDAFVWKFAHQLDVVRERAFKAIAAERPEGAAPAGPGHAMPHAAIEQFLEALRRASRDGAGRRQ